jgi:hypothetical protein
MGIDERAKAENLGIAAILLPVFGLALGVIEFLWYLQVRKPDSLEGIHRELLLRRFKEAKGRVEKEDTRVWISRSTKELVIPFQSLRSVEGKWAGSRGVVAVQGEGVPGGQYVCVPDEKVPDWGEKMTMREGYDHIGFEPQCSVELLITEANVHKTINVAAKMEVTYPVLTERPRYEIGAQIPGRFVSGKAEVSREFQLFVASAEEAERMHHWERQQGGPPQAPEVYVTTFLSLGMLGAGFLLRGFLGAARRR